MPKAARSGDFHFCPKFEPGPVPHLGGNILPRPGATVFIGGEAAAREGDKALCNGPPDEIAKGSPTVFIEHKRAARLGDPTQHGGFVVVCHPKVRIGDSGQGASIMSASAPLVKICDKPQKDVTV